MLRALLRCRSPTRTHIRLCLSTGIFSNKSEIGSRDQFVSGDNEFRPFVFNFRNFHYILTPANKQKKAFSHGTQCFRGSCMVCGWNAGKNLFYRMWCALVYSVTFTIILLGLGMETFFLFSFFSLYFPVNRKCFQRQPGKLYWMWLEIFCANKTKAQVNFYSIQN